MTADRTFWRNRYAAGVDIRTVGCRDLTVQQNESQYALAAEQFKTFVATDLGNRRESVLDLGYGLGHYAKVCHELAFADYVGVDFVASAGPSLGSRYAYQQGDIGETLDLGRTFDLVIAIDVLFHVTDDQRFETALQNIHRHASDVIYVTGIPEDRRIAAHVIHRDLKRFCGLGELIGVSPWRDTSIMRFRIKPTP